MVKRKYNKLSELLLFLFAITEILAKIMIQSVVLKNAIIAGVGGLCLIQAFLQYPFIRNGILKIGVVFSVLLLINMVVIGNSTVTHLLWIWAYLGFSALLYSNGMRRKTSMAILFIYTLFFIYNAFLDTSPDDLLIGESSNSVSVMYIFAISLYYLTIYRENPTKSMPYSPVLILGFLSIWAANRSGVLCSIFLASLIIIYNLRSNNISFGYNVKLLLIIIMLVIFADSIMGRFGDMFIQKQERLGLESDRTLIWAQYLQSCWENPIYLLFGVNSSDSNVYLFHFFSGNAHNAFLILHSKCGIGGLFIILAAVVRFYIYSIRRRMYPLLIVFSTIVLRSMFDWTAFWGLFDVFFWYIMFEIKYRELFNNLTMNRLD